MKYSIGSNQFKKTVKVSVKSEFKRVMKESLKVVMVLSFVAGSIVGTYALGGASTSAQVVYADHDVTVIATTTPPFPPMLQKICNAESGGKQFLPNGNVVRGKVTPDDVGICQIHESLWEDKARALGYDIYTLQGNEDMALYLFNNYGVQPWSASQPIWSKM
jgi:hypothetical protein